jgi:hypothetical protein
MQGHAEASRTKAIHLSKSADGQQHRRSVGNNPTYPSIRWPSTAVRAAGKNFWNQVLPVARTDICHASRFVIERV